MCPADWLVDSVQKLRARCAGCAKPTLLSSKLWATHCVSDISPVLFMQLLVSSTMSMTPDIKCFACPDLWDWLIVSGNGCVIYGYMSNSTWCLRPKNTIEYYFSNSVSWLPLHSVQVIKILHLFLIALHTYVKAVDERVRSQQRSNSPQQAPIMLRLSEGSAVCWA